MKILAMGDFHGKFPEKLKKEARKVDLIEIKNNKVKNVKFLR